MSEPTPGDPVSAEVVLPARPFAETLAFFTRELGFRVAEIRPADDPRSALIAGHGVRLRLDASFEGPPATLRIARTGAPPAEPLTAPNGTRIEVVAATTSPALPDLEPAFTMARITDGGWRAGRVDMRYRDLLPHRQGGRYGASHIRIESGGKVEDYVHYHRVHFQLIYCYRGWVRLAYEDQGPELCMREGDCILQPPEIRHRVLESSPGLEVVELSSPAEHPTLGDLEMNLPTDSHDPERRFDGQRFAHHVAARAEWRPAPEGGFEERVLGLAGPSGGRLEARVLRTRSGAEHAGPAKGELLFRFLLEGSIEAEVEGREPFSLEAGDAFHVPAGRHHSIRAARGSELLQVEVPA